MIYHLWKNHVRLDDKNVSRVVAFKVIICILEKWSSCMHYAISLFPFVEFPFYFFSLKGIVLKLNCAIKKCGSSCLFKSLRPLYLFTYSIDWKTVSCSRDACAYSPDYVIFMRSTGCVVQYWGITLTKNLNKFKRVIQRMHLSLLSVTYFIQIIKVWISYITILTSFLLFLFNFSLVNFFYCLGGIPSQVL